MQVNIINTENNATIRLQGRFDFNSHRDFRAAVDTVLKGPQAQLTVDFDGVDYLDSSALGMLLMLRDKAGAANKTVILANCGGSVRQILDIANFSKLFSIS